MAEPKTHFRAARSDIASALGLIGMAAVTGAIFGTEIESDEITKWGMGILAASSVPSAIKLAHKYVNKALHSNPLTDKLGNLDDAITRHIPQRLQDALTTTTMLMGTTGSLLFLGNKVAGFSIDELGQDMQKDFLDILGVALSTTSLSTNLFGWGRYLTSGTYEAPSPGVSAALQEELEKKIGTLSQDAPELKKHSHKFFEENKGTAALVRLIAGAISGGAVLATATNPVFPMAAALFFTANAINPELDGVWGQTYKNADKLAHDITRFVIETPQEELRRLIDRIPGVSHSLHDPKILAELSASASRTLTAPEMSR